MESLTKFYINQSISSNKRLMYFISVQLGCRLLSLQEQDMHRTMMCEWSVRKLLITSRVIV